MLSVQLELQMKLDWVNGLFFSLLGQISAFTRMNPAILSVSATLCFTLSVCVYTHLPLTHTHTCARTHTHTHTRLIQRKYFGLEIHSAHLCGILVLCVWSTGFRWQRLKIHQNTKWWGSHWCFCGKCVSEVVLRVDSFTSHGSIIYP